VEEVNKLVLGGMPFRDAYQKVGRDIERGNYRATGQIAHTHEGSIGNLKLDAVVKMMEGVLANFQFDRVHQALTRLHS
jgi:argininosuccinate lyase